MGSLGKPCDASTTPSLLRTTSLKYPKQQRRLNTADGMCIWRSRTLLLPLNGYKITFKKFMSNTAKTSHTHRTPPTISHRKSGSIPWLPSILKRKTHTWISRNLPWVDTVRLQPILASRYQNMSMRHPYVNNLDKLCLFLPQLCQILTTLCQISIFMSKNTNLCQNGSDPYVTWSLSLCQNYFQKPKRLN